jgi:hypothetical protein
LRSPEAPERERHAEHALDLQLDPRRALLTWRKAF